MNMSVYLRSKADAKAKSITEDWGRLTWLASQELTGSDLTLGRVTIKKGHANPRHAHDNCEEVLYLLKGRLRHSVGQESVVMEAGDTLAIPAGIMHHADSIGDTDADMIVAYSSGQRDFRTEG